MSNTAIIVTTLVISTLAIALTIYIDRRRPRKRQGVVRDKYNALIEKWHFRFDRNVITYKHYKQIYRTLASTTAYDDYDLKKNSILLYLKSNLICLFIFIGCCISMRDLTAILANVFLILYMREIIIYNTLKKIGKEVRRQAKEAITSLGEMFAIHDDVQSALATCEAGPLVRRSITEISSILDALDPKSKLLDFLKSKPITPIRTLAITCYNMNDLGEAKKSTGLSPFREAMSSIVEELDDELDLIVKRDILFQNRTNLPLMPLLMLGPVQYFFSYNVPGVTSVYVSTLGYILRLLQVIISGVGFMKISKAASDEIVQENDKNRFILRLSKKKWMKDIVTNIIPKHPKKLKKLERAFRRAISKKSVAYLYTEKLAYAVIAFFVTLVCSIFILMLARNSVYDNMQSTSLLASAERTKAETEELRKLDEYCISIYPAFLQRKDLEGRIKSIMPKIEELDMQEEVERIYKKVEQYHSLKFTPYIFLICYAVAIGFWFLPNELLNSRAKKIKMLAGEDIMQMQTLISILAPTPIDTEDLLYWLALGSRVFKEPLMFAHYEYASDPELAINRLKLASDNIEFRQMCMRLRHTISDISLSEAFINLKAEKAHNMHQRKTILMNNLESRSRTASLWAIAPTVFLIIVYILVPLGIVAYGSLGMLIGEASM